jgi:hypothetical protein
MASLLIERLSGWLSRQVTFKKTTQNIRECFFAVFGLDFYVP